jgi:shikimate dehydrogenase
MSTPDRYAVIGHPIAHSLSPRIHTLFARQTAQALSYEAFDVPPQQLSTQLKVFFASGGRGLNVTVPHKQAVVAFADELSERAQRAGAINTLALSTTGRLMGDNTDGVGLVRDLTTNLELTLAGRRLLLLGAGGAARGVLAPLLALGPAELVIANRDPERAQRLLSDCAASGPVRARAFPALSGAFDLIVNATAASLHGELPELPPGLIGPASVCYDLAYGPEPTAFMRWAHMHGAGAVHMGLGMLVEQAAESFYLWRAVRPQTAPVLAALRAERVAL